MIGWREIDSLPPKPKQKQDGGERKQMNKASVIYSTKGQIDIYQLSEKLFITQIITMKKVTHISHKQI